MLVSYRLISPGRMESHVPAHSFSWSLLEILVMVSLIIFLGALGWKLGLCSFTHFRERRKTAKDARKERLKEQFRLEETQKK